MATTALAVGVGFSALGQYQAGKDNQAIARHNAQLGEMRAIDSEKRGEETQQQVRKEFRALVGQQKVGFATQNVAVDVGNAQEIAEDTEMILELEVNAIENNASLEAWGFRSGAQESILQGNLARSAGTFGATGTLLSGIGSVAVAARTPTFTPAGGSTSAASGSTAVGGGAGGAGASIF